MWELDFMYFTKLMGNVAYAKNVCKIDTGREISEYLRSFNLRDISSIEKVFRIRYFDTIEI